MITCRSDLRFIVYSQWLLHTYFNTEIKASSEESVTIIFIPMIVLQVNSVTLKLRTFAIRDFTVHVSKCAKIVSLYFILTSAEKVVIPIFNVATVCIHLALPVLCWRNDRKTKQIRQISRCLNIYVIRASLTENMYFNTIQKVLHSKWRREHP